MTPWDFVNAINYDKRDLFEDAQAEKDYNSFMINRALSYFPDTIFFANEMNKQPHLSKDMQFDFLRHAISKRKRFSKWTKKETITSDISVIQSYYKYSVEKSLEVLPLLSREQLEYIHEQMGKGGKK